MGADLYSRSDTHAGQPRAGYEDKRADVQYRPELVEPAALIKAIDDIGFMARELDPEDEAPSP